MSFSVFVTRIEPLVRIVSDPRSMLPVPVAGDDVGSEPVVPLGPGGGSGPVAVAPVGAPLAPAGAPLAPDGPVVKNGDGDGGGVSGSLEHAAASVATTIASTHTAERRRSVTVAGRYHGPLARP